MPREPKPRDAKSKQASVDLEDHEEFGEESSEESGGELVLSASIKQSSIPGFSQEQVNGLNDILAQMTAIMDAKLDAKLEAQNR